MTTVFFATIAAGGGHMATANAMAEALTELDPGVGTRVSDVMAEFGFEELDRRHKNSWRQMLKRPRLVRWGQRMTDAAPVLTRTAQDLLLNRFSRAAAQRLDALAPDLVVANHGWLATALTLAQTRHAMRSKLLVYATEPFDASALWAAPQAQCVAAPSQAAKQDLVRLGVPAAKVHVLGYPVSRAFLRPAAQEAARAKLGLAHAFTCLLSLGAEGVAGETVPLVRALLLQGLQVVVITGRNAALKGALEKIAENERLLVPVGYTTAMPDYLAAADVVVGKAGPASTMEALAMGRPVIVTAYAGLNEQRVVRFLQSRSLGSYAPTPAQVVEQVAQWRRPGQSARAARTAASLDFEGMRARLARFTLELTRGGHPKAESGGPFEATSAESLAGSVKAEARLAR